MKKLISLLAVPVLWSVVFLPNGQYVVVNDGQTESETIMQTQGGGYHGFYSYGGGETLVPTGNNSYHYSEQPSFQNFQPTYQAPTYQQTAPDFRVKPYYDWNQ